MSNAYVDHLNTAIEELDLTVASLRTELTEAKASHEKFREDVLLRMYACLRSMEDLADHEGDCIDTMIRLIDSVYSRKHKKPKKIPYLHDLENLDE